MSLLSTEDLRLLAERRAGWHVSLFLPMHRAGVDTLQNPVRCKNLLRQAEARLLAGGLRASEVQTLLAPVSRLLGDYTFWQHQSDGLALFVAPDVFRAYCLPLSFPELVVVTRRFHLKPLLPLLSEDGQFYILALSQNQVRLLECTRYSVNQVMLPDTPTSLAEALQYDDPERQLQFHTKTQTFARPGTGERGAIFFGTGAAAEDNKTNLVEYFRQVDRGLTEVVQHPHVPVVLAGVEYLLPLYKEVTAHAAVVEPGMTGNPDELSAATLHERAWALVEPHFRQAREEAVARYQRYAGTGRAVSDLSEVILAASHGRVETLFVALGTQCWGVFDSETQDIQLVSEEAPEAEDLLDCAALHTFLNSGTVYAVPPDQVPAPAPLAAILRY
jgi:hypothetical protein